MLIKAQGALDDAVKLIVQPPQAACGPNGSVLVLAKGVVWEFNSVRCHNSQGT